MQGKQQYIGCYFCIETQLIEELCKSEIVLVMVLKVDQQFSCTNISSKFLPNITKNNDPNTRNVKKITTK